MWDGAEVCCGSAMLSRCLRFGAGLNVAAFDIADWGPYAVRRGLGGLNNPLDMSTAAGMASLF